MMDQFNEQLSVAEGMSVLGSDGESVGEIAEVNADHFVVRKGFFFPEDHYIPNSAVVGVDGQNVSLNVTKDEAMNQNPSWSQPPAGMATAGASGGMEDDPEPFRHEQDSPRTHVNEPDDIRVDIHEEELVARRRDVDRGDVRVRKDVVAEEQQIDVPVTEERVNVQRRTVDREVAPEEDAFTEGTIDVPVHGEEVDVEKRARVTGEVDIDKTAEQHTERVRDTVRHEEVSIEGEEVDGSQREATKSGRGNKKKRR